MASYSTQKEIPDISSNFQRFQQEDAHEFLFNAAIVVGHSSDTYEPLIDLSLEIENMGTLPSALESFTKVEKIEDPGQSSLVNNAPSVAAFHLKRFKNDGSYAEKIDKHVEFPLELDLLPYTGGDQNNDMELKYNLYAVVVHIEFSSTSGHYYCFIHSAPDAWYMLDDSKMDYLVHKAKLYMTDWHYKHFWKKYIFLDRCVWKRFGWTSSYIFGKTSSYIF
ncbi:ubiquitin carboxyl-terminal hydrolase 20-like [Camellia sinensis]|uniref:ubiquitin carboxyl-terminal hydrolase 20-like n=1 Tax=Camellia sinensis TaxID=4442 RepID=UPI0010362856|nr:ubiquitin carboxyl-terminal hydrolase 20-like [Camellia sinensis]